MTLLQVDRDQFLNGVHVLDGMIKRKRQAKAIFTFADGVLSIKIANTVVEMPATGEWSGTAKIAAQVLFRAVSPVPTVETVTLTVEGSRLSNRTDFNALRMGWLSEIEPHSRDLEASPRVSVSVGFVEDRARPSALSAGY